MVSMAPMNNISVLSVSRFIPHVIKQCQHVHLQQLQQSWLISSVVYFIIIVALARKVWWHCGHAVAKCPHLQMTMRLHSILKTRSVSYRPSFCSIWGTRIFCSTSSYSLLIKKTDIFIWLSAEHTLNFSLSYSCPMIWARHDTAWYWMQDSSFSVLTRL
jgi:hypothetical protein